MSGTAQNVLLVITTLPDRTSAEQLAGALIECRAAACVNVLAECSSFYRWQGKVENSNEIPLLIKTTQSAYPRLEQEILTRHPYELPEIVAVPLSAGLPDYLQWVAQETLPPEK